MTGDDVTAQVMTLSGFAQPDPTTDVMLSTGGGVMIPLGGHASIDVGYRFSHVAAHTPLHAQSVTFGLGFRF